MIAEIWSRAVPERIQYIDIGRAAPAGARRVILSTWGGRIYVLRGEDGKREWRSRAFTYPPGFLNFLEMFGETYLLASFGNELRVVKPEEKGEIVRETSLDSVVTRAGIEDLNQDGRKEIVACTGGDQLYVFNDKFNELWKKEITLPPSPSALLMEDIDYDGKSELLVGEKDEFHIFSYNGEEVFTKEFSNSERFFSLATGYFSKDGSREIAVGLQDGLRIIKDYKEVVAKNFDFYPYLLTSGDLDGDERDEIVVGDWKEDSLSVLKLEGESISKHYSLPLESNPTSCLVADIEGDGHAEILTTCEDETFKIFKGDSLLEEKTGFPGEFNIKMGDLLGKGQQDIVVQTGREKVSLLTHVPRISAPSWIKEGMGFSTYTIVESGNELTSLNQNIKISGKEYLGRQKLENVGYVSFYEYACNTRRAGRGKVHIEKKPPTLPIQIASRRRITKDSHVWLTDEDFASLDTGKDAQLGMKRFTYRKSRGKNGVWFSSLVPGDFPIEIRLKDPRSKKVSKVRSTFHIERSGSVAAELPALTFNKTQASVRVRNKSGRRLKAYFRGNENIEVAPHPLTLPPESEKETQLELTIKMGEEKKKQVRENIRFIYAGLNNHTLFMPIQTLTINENWAKGYLERFREKLDIEETIAKMSMSLHVGKDQLRELFSQNDLI